MKKYWFRILLFLFTFFVGCITEFVPQVEENKELLVVEGMITDQNRTNVVKLSKSLPLGSPLVRKPVRGATVSIVDNRGITTALKETGDGIYTTDSTKFIGAVGKRYLLKIKSGSLHYESTLMEMRPVPPIDSVYYEKILINASNNPAEVVEGCKIYIDTHDPKRECLYYRWEYTETWEFHLPYGIVNPICWRTEKSDKILIKNTTVYNRARVSKFQLNFIDNSTDRLKAKYSILVTQYSLSADEYNFWEKIQNVTESVGSLYDIIPMTITGNIRCVEKPEDIVLGYFSVCAVTEKRIFIKDYFRGIPNFYQYCAGDTLRGSLPKEDRNINWWLLGDFSNERPPYYLITRNRECVDCTTRGSKEKPSFWID